MKNKRIGCINRDKNSCFNIKRIFKYYIKTGERHSTYSREPIINANQVKTLWNSVKPEMVHSVYNLKINFFYYKHE